MRGQVFERALERAAAVLFVALAAVPTYAFVLRAGGSKDVSPESIVGWFRFTIPVGVAGFLVTFVISYVREVRR